MGIKTHLDYTCDLGSGPPLQALSHYLFTGDEQAHRFAVQCTRKGERVNLTGATVKGYFIRADGATVIIAGSVESGDAVVVLPPECYAIPGRFSLVIKASMGDVVSTILWAEGAVSRSQTGAIVDPGTVVPSLDELLARIAEMESAAADAREAAREALDAANAANATAIGPIMPEGQGRTIVNLLDASDKTLQNIRIFGQTRAGNPAPDAPATPIGPGDKGSVNVKVLGKNLFDKDHVTFAVGLINSSGAVDGSITHYVHTESYIQVKPNTEFVFSGVILTNDTSNSVAFYDANKRFISRYASGVAGLNSKFTTPADCWYIRFNAAANAYDPATIQLEVGNLATAYTPYTEQTAGMATWSLHGVKVGSNGNYTDENGQMWLADYIDGSTGQRITNIPNQDYNGTNYEPAAANAANTAWQMALPVAGSPIDYGVDQTGMVFTNRLPTLSRERVISGEQGAAINNTHVIICVNGVNTLAGIKAWLAAEPLRVFYRPAAPMNKAVAMTESEALAFKALRTANPNTTIINDVNAWMQIDYVADLQSYIDNRIAALAAAII